MQRHPARTLSPRKERDSVDGRYAIGFLRSVRFTQQLTTPPFSSISAMP